MNDVESKTQDRIAHLAMLIGAWIFTAVCLHFAGKVLLAANFMEATGLIGFFGVVYIWCQSWRGK